MPPVDKSHLPFPNLPVSDILNVQAHQAHLRAKADRAKLDEHNTIVKQEDFLRGAGIKVPYRRNYKK